MESFLILAHQVQGISCCQLVIDALNHPKTFYFKDLLKELEHKLLKFPIYLSLLNIFTFGGYSDYRSSTVQFPEISPVAIYKLKLLEFTSICTSSKCIEYHVLLNQLSLENIGQLEDLIMKSIDAGLVVGCMDQKNVFSILINDKRLALLLNLYLLETFPTINIHYYCIN